MAEDKQNIKLIIAYDGTAYHGFQRQHNASRTIQQVLEEALERVAGHIVTVTGAGRTDSGVHAYGQVVHFLSGATIPVERIPQAVAKYLPPDIVVCSAELMPLSFHARRSAQGKVYRYQILQDKTADPFLRNYCWRIARPLDMERMNQAAAYIIGEHDFSAFRAVGGKPMSPVRHIYSATLSMEGNIIVFRISGNGFLYRMVRNVMGTLVDVGLGKCSLSDFQQILASRQRHLAGATAPPQGLFLERVWYE